MSLRDQAAVDAQIFVEDAVAGFATAIVLTNPNGETLDMTGLTTDVYNTIDPDTGLSVVGRKVSATLSLKTLKEKCFSVPRGIEDSGQRPWTVEFFNVLGECNLFKVSEAEPDAEMGVVVCHLEAYSQ